MVVTTLACPNSSCTVMSVHIKWRTIRPYPVLLHARPVSFPKTIALFGGIVDIHDFHHRNPLNVKRLSDTEALHNR